MGQKVLFAVLCWLVLCASLVVAKKYKIIVKDNTKAESAPRLYRNAPVGVYAAPFGAYSFQIPYTIQPKAAASRVIPVKENLVIPHTYLKDSYGNRFVESPQSVPFKPPFPQQYLQLQELPAHFAQPLAAASPNFQFKQATPQLVFGSHYRLPLQAAAPSPIHSIGFSQPSVYASNIKSLAPFSNLRTVSDHPAAQVNLHSTHHNHGHSIPTSQHGREHSELKSHHNRDHTAPKSQAYRHHQETTQDHGKPSAQQQSTSNKAVYTNAQPREQYNTQKSEPKYERLQEAPQEERHKEHTSSQQEVHHDKAPLKTATAKETSINTYVNGQKTVINLETKPLPLLDISLLEPLTFANPLVPQVQHFLPRINEATYHKLPSPNIGENKNYQKEFVVQKTKSYDSGVIKGKPKKGAPKKTPKVHSNENENTYNEAPHSPTKPSITVKGIPNHSPEFSYEINSPNYKETYKEQAVSYNKETDSEPVHYTYGTNTKNEPVHYSYVHSSKEPVVIKEVHYEGKGEGPKHLIYNFKNEEQNSDEGKRHQPQQSESEDSGESSEHSDDEGPEHRHNNEHQEHQQEARKTSHPQKTEHKEQEYHYSPKQVAPQTVHHNLFHTFNGQPVQYYLQSSAIPFHPVTQYEEDIKLATIKVNPNQHVQTPQQHQTQSSGQKQPPHPTTTPESHRFVPQSSSPSKPYNEPKPHIHEKSTRVIIQEETPEDTDTDSYKDHMSEMFGKEENKEEDFEKAYKNAAFGFPAFSKSVDVEKDIYNPESYGVPRDHSEYSIDHSPFQQYHEEGDTFPKAMRLSYKDERDKTKEDYFLDYSVNRPESLTDRYRKKVDYYKLYKNQKPEKYYTIVDDSKKQKQNEKYTFAPTFEFSHGAEHKPKQVFAQYKTSPGMMFEYDYSKGEPRDNSPHASGPIQSYKTKTQFVEPQFQYGFEPLTIPRLLDSELAAMASNNSPESEKPGMRKKIYKENFYIKKTSMSDGDPAS